VCDASLSTGITLSLRLQEPRHGIWLVDLTWQFNVRPSIDEVTVYSKVQIKISIAETSYRKYAFVSTTVLSV
jgi:hypothetical protein